MAELLTQQFKFHPLGRRGVATTSTSGPGWTTTTISSTWSRAGPIPDGKADAEVHCFWTDRYVVTVHRGECPAIAEVHERLLRAHHAQDVASPQLVIVYFVLSALAEQLLPLPVRTSTIASTSSRMRSFESRPRRSSVSCSR